MASEFGRKDQWRRRIRSFTQGSVLAFALTGAAHAQDSPRQGEAPAASTQAVGLSDIIVTAQRRRENAQTLPIAATVASGDLLNERQVNDVQGLQNIAPSLSMVPVSGEPFINIRGVGTQQTTTTSSAGVALSLDAVFIPNLRLAQLSFFDLASVEVLRGPQGALIGQNSTGGAILITTNQPKFDEFGGYVEQTIGTYARSRTEAAVNAPISGTLAARIAVAVESRHSFTRNLGAGTPGDPAANTHPGNVGTRNLRLQLAFRPSADLTATLRFEGYDSRNDGPAIKPLANPALDPFNGSIQSRDYTIAYDTDQRRHTEGYIASGQMEWTVLDGITLRSVTAFQHGRTRDRNDYDYGRSVPGLDQVRDESADTFTQEINILSDKDKPFSWLLGAYYLDLKNDIDLNFSLTAPGAPPAPLLGVIGRSRHESLAVFGQFNYKILPQLVLTVGGRHSHDKQPFDAVTTVSGVLDLPTAIAPKENSNTGRAAISWTPREEVTLYGSIANGFKAGGGNLSGLTPAPPYRSERNVVAEIGIKTTLLDRRLRLNLDAFQSRYKNIQFQNIIGGFPLTENADRATIRGAEAEATGAFGAFGFNLGAAYLKSRIDEAFLLAGQIVPVGRGLPYSPKWTANVSAHYAIPLGDGSLVPLIQYSYAASQYVLLDRSPITRMPPRNRVDASLSYEAMQGWKAKLYVTNLFDRHNVAAVIPATLTGPTGIAFDAPREAGVMLTYRF